MTWFLHWMVIPFFTALGVFLLIGLVLAVVHWLVFRL